jgi:hypothetical protein
MSSHHEVIEISDSEDEGPINSPRNNRASEPNNKAAAELEALRAEMEASRAEVEASRAEVEASRAEVEALRAVRHLFCQSEFTQSIVQQVQLLRDEAYAAALQNEELTVSYDWASERNHAYERATRHLVRYNVIYPHAETQ